MTQALPLLVRGSVLGRLGWGAGWGRRLAVRSFCFLEAERALLDRKWGQEATGSGLVFSFPPLAGGVLP